MEIIIHIIDNLRRGGAETLLLDVVKRLTQYRNYIVTLTDTNEFNKDELAGLEIISLGFRNITSYPGTVIRLRKIINKYKPALIHAHLPFASFVARVARPASVPLFISIHNNYSDSLKAVSKKMFLLEKKLHSKNEKLIFVSSAIKEDYNRIIGIKSEASVLYNFIADKYFDNAGRDIKNYKTTGVIRMVSVGSFKKQKNFESLVLAFSHLSSKDFSLDIYGEGAGRKTLEELIESHRIRHVILKGAVPDIEKRLPSYDAFILASLYEGFGLAPLEAAAVGLPLVLSNIDVFREVTKGQAVYFDPQKIEDIVGKLHHFRENYQVAVEKASAFTSTVSKNYSKENYIKQLVSLYNSK